MHWMLLVMLLSVDLSFAGNNTPDSKFGIVCTPSWTLNTKKLEETNEPHIIVVCNTLVPILSWQIRLLVAKEKREMTVRIPEMKSRIFSIINKTLYDKVINETYNVFDFNVSAVYH